VSSFVRSFVRARDVATSRSIERRRARDIHAFAHLFVSDLTTRAIDHFARARHARRTRSWTRVVVFVFRVFQCER